MTTLDIHPLNFMPMEILEHIFSFLPVRDRHNVSRMCNLWATAVSSPSVWSFTEVQCDSYKAEEEEDGGTLSPLLQNIQPYVAHIRYLKLVLDVSLEINRRLACTILDEMAWKSRRLQGLQIMCFGKGPLFYSCQDVRHSLVKLFQGMYEATMQHVDLRQMPFILDNGIVSLVGSCSPNLRTFLINNRELTMLRRETIVEVLRSCPKLSTLGVSYFALSPRMFQELLSPEREPFKYLELFYDGLENDIPAKCWTSVRERHPGFHVGLEIASCIAVQKITEVLKPYLPISHLRFNTYTNVASQLRLVTKFYAGTLERLVLRSTPSIDLNMALIQVARTCVHLKEIHFSNTVSLVVVESFRRHCPHLKMYTTAHGTSFCVNPPTVEE